jgi:predicted DNA-binding transcriptional regulator YafY
MNRLQRLVNILIHLQSKRIIKSQELANKFEISLRTVYRDIASLEQAGVPILSEAGVGYSLLKGYNLPPLQLTDDEVTAFFTAGKFLHIYSEKSVSSSFESGLTKIKAIINLAEKERVSVLEEKLKVLANQYLEKKEEGKVPFNEVFKAVYEKLLLEFNYIGLSDHEPKARKVEPIGIYSFGQHWYLIAWCKEKEDYRTFRFDRITNLEILNERFNSQHPKMDVFIQKLKSEKGLQKVVIQVDMQAYKYVDEQKYYQGIVSEEKIDDKMVMTFLTGSLEGFSHWFLLLGSEADIIEPQILKEMVTQKAKNVISRVSK